MPMTEEDQILVAKAVLAGVRFSRTRSGFWATPANSDSGGMFTVGRAAAFALHKLGLLPKEEYKEYDRRTHLNYSGPVDVDCDGW